MKDKLLPWYQCHEYVELLPTSALLWSIPNAKSDKNHHPNRAAVRVLARPGKRQNPLKIRPGVADRLDSSLTVYLFHLRVILGLFRG